MRYFFIMLFFGIQNLYSQNHIEERSSVLEVFTPYIGTWNAPDSVIQKNDHMQGRAIFKFEFNANQSLIKIYENVSLKDQEDYEFMGTIAHNPVTGKFEFFGVNAKRHFLFKGYFNQVSDKGFTREYEVYYPRDSYMENNFGPVVNFREDFVLQKDNSLVFNIQYYNRNTRKWAPWSNQSFVLLKSK